MDGPSDRVKGSSARKRLQPPQGLHQCRDKNDADRENVKREEGSERLTKKYNSSLSGYPGLYPPSRRSRIANYGNLTLDRDQCRIFFHISDAEFQHEGFRAWPSTSQKLSGMMTHVNRSLQN